MSVIELIRGDTPTYDLTLTGTSGGPLDLTGMDITFTAKRRYSDADEDAVIRHDLDDGITVVDAEGGTATVAFAVGDTADLDDLPTLVWDVQVEDQAGVVLTPLRGKLSVVRDVTRNLASS